MAGIVVQVRRRILRIARKQAAAVDQHQGAAGAEAAKVDRRGAGGAIGDGGALVREHLRQAIQEIFDAGRAFQLDFLRVHRGDGADRGQVRLRDARAGDDDFLHSVRGGVLRERRRRDRHGRTEKNSGRQKALTSGFNLQRRSSESAPPNVDSPQNEMSFPDCKFVDCVNVM